jgi:Cu/Ag efflux protein CusF
MKAISLIFAVLLVSAAGIQDQGMPMSMEAKPAASAVVKASTVMVDAEVKNLDTEKGTVVLKHGDITNLGMPGMTMGFDVSNKYLLQGVNAGD